MPVLFAPSSQEASKREYAAESRSTSAGSRESGELQRAAQGYALPSGSPSLPDYEYPVPFVVRNTFIETQVGRPVSLDEFFKERRIHSSPAVPKEREEQCCDATGAPEPQPLRRAITAGAQAFISSMVAATGIWNGEQQPTPATAADSLNTPQPMPRVLMLSEALPGPALGSNELPTVGSGGHHLGTCKPCAFFYTRGCENGTECPFCHLCPPDEKRRRQKDKQAAFREMRRQRRQVRL